MEMKVLKEKLEVTKAKIKANSTDPHFADMLISELLTTKAQLDHEPTIAYAAIKDAVETKKGDTFEINIMNDGTAILHTYGGYTIIASPRMSALNSQIRKLADLLDKDGDDDIKDAAVLYTIITSPSFIFTDEGLMLQVAADILDWEVGLTEELLNAELGDPDPIKDMAYEDGVMFAEMINDINDGKKDDTGRSDSEQQAGESGV